MILGSLQDHAASALVRGGYCPCVGTTDFGLPKVIKIYELKDNSDRVNAGTFSSKNGWYMHMPDRGNG